ncbi:MAG: hypothetical protein LBQ46_05475 [Treponema sp.]|jgi:hypothetical protein|nr:hypothetical protein [Treponema sp.]
MAVSQGTKHSVLCVLAAAAVYSLAACASTEVLAGPERPAPGRAGTETPRLSRTEPAEKPCWVDAVPKSAEELYFIGVSNAFSSAAGARNAAREDAFNQVLKYYGEYIQASSVEKTSTAGAAGALDSYLEKEEDITRFAQAVVSQVGADRYYTEIYANPAGGEAYIVYVLCQIPRQKAEQDIRDFARNISQRYGGLLAGQAALTGALKVYAGLAESLRENPLHRALAYYDSPNGRVGLYEYCTVQAGSLSGSITFGSIPAQTIRKGDTLNTIVTLSSPLYQSIGAALCRVDIVGAAAPAARYALDADNTFLLQIHTAKLDPGPYNVHLELLLDAPANPSSGFSFEVLPVSAVIAFSGSPLTEAEQDTLSGGLQAALQRYAVSLQNGCVFVIAFNVKEQEGAFAGLSVSETSLTLLKDGETLCRSETKRITEIDRNRALRLAANFYRDNGTFWTQVKQLLEN